VIASDIHTLFYGFHSPLSVAVNGVDDFLHNDACRPIRASADDGDPLKGKTFHGAGLDWINSILQTEDEDCQIWPFAKNDNGYARITIEGKQLLVHRIVCEKVNGPSTKEKPLALHSCGNGHLGCASPKHLRWGDHQQNAKDAESHGIHQKGSRNNQAKLTQDQVEEIRKKSSEGIKDQELADQFSVHRVTINRIKNRKIWND